MEKITIGMIATLVAVLAGSLPGIFAIFAGDLTTLVSSVMNNLQGHFALTSGLGSCCICIPIPLAFGVFALHQRVKASVVEETVSQSSDG